VLKGHTLDYPAIAPPSEVGIAVFGSGIIAAIINAFIGAVTLLLVLRAWLDALHNL
jgi:hypothetical protein